VKAYYEDYKDIQPAVNARLVTDLPGILTILKNELGISLTSDISLIKISPVDRSAFRVYSGNECQVEIRRGEQDIRKYIVNIDDKTARIG
jgi:hypothetical protein